MIPDQFMRHLTDKCSEGLALALACDDDGAVMTFQWCNPAFSRITGYAPDEVIGQRGTILIGPGMEQGVHLQIIERLMKWENFVTRAQSNRKCGALYQQRLGWTHLTDPASGAHWWLCSVIDMEDQQGPAPAPRIPDDKTDTVSQARFVEKIRRLEKENARLLNLAKAVAKDANEDALTGLSNRRHFEVELKTWAEDLKKNRTEFAVINIDLDRFKFVNDTLGHHAGDQLLVSFAKTLRELTGDGDLVARLGGDEFVILKRLGNSALNISGLADAIVQRLKRPFDYDGKSTICSASIGVAIANCGMDDAEQVVVNADAALYHAKSQGRGRWSFFTREMHEASVSQRQLASELLLACDTRQFIPYFQPLIDARSGHIASAEMLVRWDHPTRGILAPAAFLDAAENMGILNRIDAALFTNLQRAMSRFDKTGIALPRVAINVSAARLTDPTLIHDIKSFGVDPDRLTVEILESVYLDQMGDAVRWTIDELEDLGITIALDDFGTGHASVRGLLEIKPAILKIDRHFIQMIVDDTGARSLAASLIGIGKSLDMLVVAEGVESEAHAICATELGCDFLQGYFFGKPMSEADLSKKLVKTGGVFWQPPPAAASHLTMLSAE